MFCRYCGKKVDSPDRPCPNCGKTQGALRSTDGYFGILEAGNGGISESPKQPEDHSNSKKEIAALQEKIAFLIGKSDQQERKSKALKAETDASEKKIKKLLIADLVLTAGLLIFLIASTATNKTNELKSEISDLKKAVSEAESNRQNLATENDSLKKKVAALEEEWNSLGEMQDSAGEIPESIEAVRSKVDAIEERLKNEEKVLAELEALKADIEEIKDAQTNSVNKSASSSDGSKIIIQTGNSEKGTTVEAGDSKTKTENETNSGAGDTETESSTSGETGKTGESGGDSEAGATEGDTGSENDKEQ